MPEQLQSAMLEPFHMEVDVSEEDDLTVLRIDGRIGRDYFEEMMTGEDSPNTGANIRRELRKVSTSKLRLDIASPGGDVHEALVIYDALRESGLDITTRLQGLSASAATLIALAAPAEQREISETALALPHLPMMLILMFANTENLLDAAGDLEPISKQLTQLYATETGMSYDDMKALMTTGTGKQGRFLTADEYVEKGFAARTYAPEPEAANDPDPEPELTAQAQANALRLRLAKLSYLT